VKYSHKGKRLKFETKEERKLVHNWKNVLLGCIVVVVTFKCFHREEAAFGFVLSNLLEVARDIFFDRGL
jgi:hypothetical protein